MNHEAIYALYPHTASISDTDGPVDADGNQVTIDLDLVNPDQYKHNRSRSYPSIADQLDTIYHSGIDAWKETIKAVKDEFPK